MVAVVVTVSRGMVLASEAPAACLDEEPEVTVTGWVRSPETTLMAKVVWADCPKMSVAWTVISALPRALGANWAMRRFWGPKASGAAKSAGSLSPTTEQRRFWLGRPASWKAGPTQTMVWDWPSGTVTSGSGWAVSGALEHRQRISSTHRLRWQAVDAARKTPIQKTSGTDASRFPVQRASGSENRLHGELRSHALGHKAAPSS